MATAFLAMNKVFGPIFDVSEAEAGDMEMSAYRAQASLSGQFIFDDQTHFIRDDFKQEGLLGLTKWAVGAKVNPHINDAPMTLARYKMDNYLKEIFLDSDTKVSLLSGAPFDDPSLVADLQRRHPERLSLGQQDGRQHAHAGPHRDHAQVSELDGRGRPRHRDAASGAAGSPTPSAIRSDRPSTPGAWTTRS